MTKVILYTTYFNLKRPSQKKGFYCHKSRDRGLRIPDCQDNTTQEP